MHLLHLLLWWQNHQVRTAAPAGAESPVPPRRAHGTLQPEDESTIVGYYTSGRSAVAPGVGTNYERKEVRLSQETTESTEP